MEALSHCIFCIGTRLRASMHGMTIFLYLFDVECISKQLMRKIKASSSRSFAPKSSLPPCIRHYRKLLKATSTDSSWRLRIPQMETNL